MQSLLKKEQTITIKSNITGMHNKLKDEICMPRNITSENLLKSAIMRPDKNNLERVLKKVLIGKLITTKREF